MKHLIIFLNYTQSRLDNPVYRIFTTHIGYEQEVKLLFLPTKPDERELSHQVNDIRRKNPHADITFHLCSSLRQVADKDNIISSALMIRKLFRIDNNFSYPIYIYGLMPELKKISPGITKNIWKNLTALNSAAIEYADCQLIQNIFLYSDSSQNSLAHFLYQIVISKLDKRFLSNQWDISQAKDTLWAPVFGSFSVAGEEYPEEEIRHYLRECYIKNILDYGHTLGTQVSTETCVVMARQIASKIPLTIERITLEEYGYINLSNNNNNQWSSVLDFWPACIEECSQDLKDIHKQDWLPKIKRNAMVFYQNKFRGVGVEFFYQLESKKTEDYCRVLFCIIEKEFDQIIGQNHFAPEILKSILNAFINILQQRTIEIQKRAEELFSRIKSTEQHLETIQSIWDKLSFFDRIAGKDKKTLEQYKKALEHYLISKTRYFGSLFAVKLLNELITITTSLFEKPDQIKHLLEVAYTTICQNVHDADPKQILNTFDTDQLNEATEHLCQKQEHFKIEYNKILQLYCEQSKSLDEYEFTNRIYSLFTDRADVFINQCIAEGELPQILNLPISERLNRLYSEEGGIEYYIALLKQKAIINIDLKTSDQPELNSNIPNKEIKDSVLCEKNNSGDNKKMERISEKYILISPNHQSNIVEFNFPSLDTSYLELIHIINGLNLTDLNGFSGQRTAIEPSIF